MIVWNAAPSPSVQSRLPCGNCRSLKEPCPAALAVEAAAAPLDVHVRFCHGAAPQDSEIEPVVVGATNVPPVAENTAGAATAAEAPDANSTAAPPTTKADRTIDLTDNILHS